MNHAHSDWMFEHSHSDQFSSHVDPHSITTTDATTTTTPTTQTDSVASVIKTLWHHDDLVNAGSSAGQGANGNISANASSGTTAATSSPSLAVAQNAITVSAGGSVSLPITVSQANAHTSVTISGLTSYETVTDTLDGKIFTPDAHGAVTLSAAEVNSGLSLASSYAGTGHPVNTLTVTENIGHHALTSSAQTITVTDPPATTATSTSTSSTLTLTVSGDQYQGDPTVQVLVDGQNEGTYTITADHSSGQTQTITITGNFDPTQAHQVQVEFTNDAWDGTNWWSSGGSPDGHDRNVYVESISLNGQTIDGSQATNAASNGVVSTANSHEAVLDTNGTLTFNVPDPPAVTGSSTGTGTGSAATGPSSSTSGASTGTSGTGTTGTGATEPAQTSDAFYVSPTGSDNNPGTLAAPFATLQRAQQAMESGSIKTTYVEGGTYDLTSTITLTSADNGEAWRYYPPNGVDSAVLDGGGTLSPIFDLENASNVTIDGLTLQHFTNVGILVGGNQGTTNNNNTIENCDVGSSTTAPPVEDAAATGGIVVWASPSSQNNLIENNYVHDLGGVGILAGAWTNYGASNGLNGTVISGNVIERVARLSSDNGAIYVTMAQTGDSAGRVTIKNNYIRDWGGSGYSTLQAIYLDDNASNVTVTGNVIGPPNPAVTKVNDIFVHNGNNNTISGNLFDLGSTGTVGVVAYGVDRASLAGLAGNTITNNIIISSYSGSGTTAYGGQIGSSASNYAIANNDYFNYAGGSINTSGALVGDSSPVNVDPQISGTDYSIAPNSPVFSGPVNFTPIVGRWGPPGFATTRHHVRQPSP